MRSISISSVSLLRLARRANLLLAGVGVAAPAARAQATGLHSALAPGGPQAAQVAGLSWLLIGVCTAVFFIVLSLLTLAMARRRKSDEALRADGPATGALRWVGAGIGVTVVILFTFLVASILTDRKLSSLERTEALTLTVSGHQWWWDIRYEDKQPANLVTTANEIHVPIGRPVQLNLRSADVIHSFWVPSLSGKRDLIPGHDTRLWIQADRAGTFDGVCAEFCGYQHAHMQLRVIAEPENAFQDWLRHQRASAQGPTTPGQQRGQQVFLSEKCVMCHAIQGTDAGSRVGPDLTHFASRTTLAAGTMPNTRGHLAGWVLDPQKIKPGAAMPANLLAADDLRALLDYLESLR